MSIGKSKQPRIIIPPPQNRRRRKRRGSSGMSLGLLTLLGAGAAAGLGYLLWQGDYLEPHEAVAAAIVVSAPELPDPVVATSDPLSDIDVIEGKIGKGETVSTSLTARGLDMQRIHQITEALKKEFDFRFTRAGDTYTLKLARKNGEVLSFEYRRSPLEIYMVTRGEDRALTSFRREVAPGGQLAGIGGAVSGDLFTTLEALGESSALGAYLGEIFSWQLDLYETKEGDRFRLLVEKGKEGDEIRYGKISAAEYERGGKALKAFWYIDPEGHGNYVDETGAYLRQPFLKTPLKFVPIEGERPSRREGSKGETEYLAPAGAPVVAVGEGIVETAGERAGQGLVVVLVHTDGYRSTYSHLGKLAPGLKKGVLMNQRRVLGYVGGGRSGARLSFQLEQTGKAVDLPTLPLSRGGSIPKRHRAHFDAFLEQQLAALSSVAMKDNKEAAATQKAPQGDVAQVQP